MRIRIVDYIESKNKSPTTKKKLLHLTNIHSTSLYTALLLSHCHIFLYPLPLPSFIDAPLVTRFWKKNWCQFHQMFLVSAPRSRRRRRKDVDDTLWTDENYKKTKLELMEAQLDEARSRTELNKA